MRYRITLLIVSLALLTACGNRATPTPTPAPTNSTAVPAKPTVAPIVPTTAPAPTQAPVAPAVLPRALYFIGPSNTVNQIWRLATDGVTSAQITNEPVAVTNFDVSPTDGSIAFVSGNNIIKIDANGGNRVELLHGPAINATPGPDQINTSVGAIHWKPDGMLIAYGLNGVNTIAANGGAPISVQANDPIPATPDPNLAPKFYWPADWSPDGTRILMMVSFYPEGGSLAVKTIGGGAPVFLNNPDGWPCCNPTWSLDGASIFLSNEYPGLLPAGLWNIDTTSAKGTTLVGGSKDTGTTMNLVSQAQQLADQRLYYFMSQVNQAPNQQPAVSMTSSAIDGTTDRKQLRTDSYIIGEALWDPKASGAVIKDLTGQPSDYSGATSTPLVWLKVDNTVPLKLPVFGYNLRWGK